MEHTFDNIKQALDLLDQLSVQKKRGYLSNTLIEGVYNRRGLLEDALYEWKVREAA